MSRFDALADRLLRGGVAYRHVHRLIGELKDHHEDARRAELSAGAREADADVAAWARLGDLDHVSESTLARTELRAMSARYPRLWGGAAPVLLWFGIVIATMTLLVGLVAGLRAVGLVPHGGSPALAPLQAPTDAFIFLLIRVLPVIIGATLFAKALRQRSGLMWPVVGIALMAIAGGGADAATTFSLVPDVQSSVRLGLGLSPEDGTRVGLMFALMLAPLLARRRLTQLPA